MKNSIMLIFCLVLVSCSSVKYPSIEESDAKINEYKGKMSLNAPFFNGIDSKFTAKSDLAVSVSMKSLNNILEKIAYQREDDIVIKFAYSPKIYVEEKSTLGIKYTNYVDIKSGNINVNLKSIKFESFSNNVISGSIEIEGKGDIEAGGSYLGVGASIKPMLNMYIKEPVKFDVLTADSGFIIIKPQAKEMTMKINIKINLLGLNLPWYQELPLQLKDLVKPIKIPVSFNTDFQLPVPAEKYGKNQFTFMPFILKFDNPKVKANNNKLEYQSDLELKKK